MSRVETTLALVLDGGGRFVSLMRVPPDTKRLGCIPHTPLDTATNERLGLVADRLPDVGQQRSFRLRGRCSVYGSAETALVFKEETT